MKSFLSVYITERVGMYAFKAFVENRLVGDGNMWTKMTKVKLLSQLPRK